LLYKLAFHPNHLSFSRHAIPKKKALSQILATDLFLFVLRKAPGDRYQPDSPLLMSSEVVTSSRIFFEMTIKVAMPLSSHRGKFALKVASWQNVKRK